MDPITELAISLKGGPIHLQELLRRTARIRAAARLRYYREGTEEEDVGIVWERALSFDARKGCAFGVWLYQWYRDQGSEAARKRETHARWAHCIAYEATSDAYHVDPEWLLIRAEELGSSRRTVAQMLDQQDDASRLLVRRVVVDTDMTIHEAAEALDITLAEAAEKLRVALGTMAKRRAA